MIDEIDQCKTDIINEICSLDNAKRTKVIDIRNSLNSREFILKTHYLFQTFVKKRFMNCESINENQKAQKVFLRVMKNQNFYEKLKTIYQDFISTSKEQLSKKEILFIDYEILKTKMIQSTIRNKRVCNSNIDQIKQYDTDAIQLKIQSNRESKRLYFRK